MSTMNENLRWLAINAPEWNNNLDRISRGSVGVDWFSSERFPGRIGFNRDELQDARDELLDERINNIARNGNDGIAYSTINGQTITDNTYGHWQHLTDDITAYDPPGPTSIPECTFSTPDEDEAWREAEKKLNPVWQSSHPIGGVCVFHGCRYSENEPCPMCVLTMAATKEEAKQPRYQDATGEDWIDEAARTFTPEEFRGAMRFSIGKYNRRMGKKDELVKEIEKIRDYAARWLEVEQGL